MILCHVMHEGENMCLQRPGKAVSSGLMVMISRKVVSIMRNYETDSDNKR